MIEREDVSATLSRPDSIALWPSVRARVKSASLAFRRERTGPSAFSIEARLSRAWNAFSESRTASPRRSGPRAA
jgi:hypothetical protein